MIKESGFTVLAHPSDLTIAKDHGVYILPESGYANCTNAPCSKVLQKPSVEQMRAVNAIIEGDSAFTDSAYVFGVDVMKCLIKHYEEHRPLKREICAYGDFLTCLGSDALPSEDPLQTKLREFPISAVVLPKSNFYHIGTLTEYLDNLCSHKLFKKQLAIGESSNINIHSRLPLDVHFGGRCVIECCDLSTCNSFTTGDNVILWGCQVDLGDVVVPDRVVMFTVPVKSSTDFEVGYVTLCFGIEDNMKTGTALFNKHEVGNLWQAKLFELTSSRSESFLRTLHSISAPRVSESLWSMENVLEHKFIQGIIDFGRNLGAE